VLDAGKWKIAETGPRIVLLPGLGDVRRAHLLMFAAYCGNHWYNLKTNRTHKVAISSFVQPRHIPQALDNALFADPADQQR